jgi:hypothetical protein
VHHVPWTVHRAEASVQVGALLKTHGLKVSGQPHLLYTRGVDVVLWGLKSVR